MTKLEKENYRLAWKWGKRLEKSVRFTKCLIRDAFENYIKAEEFEVNKKSPLPENVQKSEWERNLYKNFKEHVLDNSFLGHFNYTDPTTKAEYNIDFISESEGFPDKLGYTYYGFKIWNKGWSLKNKKPVYVRFIPSQLQLGGETNWETNSSRIHPEVENYLYKNVLPEVLSEMKLVINNLKECIYEAEITKAEQDFKVGK